jgi:hypothetical protein
MTTKNTQAMKISASWTPNEDMVEAMMQAMFGGSAGAPLKFTSGRLQMKHAIKADFADPAHMIRVSQRVAEVKELLEGYGTLHGFNTSAGAVPHAEAEVLGDDLPEPEPILIEDDAPASEAA